MSNTIRFDSITGQRIDKVLQTPWTDDVLQEGGGMYLYCCEVIVVLSDTRLFALQYVEPESEQDGVSAYQGDISTLIVADFPWGEKHSRQSILGQRIVDCIYHSLWSSFGLVLGSGQILHSGITIPGYCGATISNIKVCDDDLPEDYRSFISPRRVVPDA